MTPVYAHISARFGGTLKDYRFIILAQALYFFSTHFTSLTPPIHSLFSGSSRVFSPSHEVIPMDFCMQGGMIDVKMFRDVSAPLTLWRIMVNVHALHLLIRQTHPLFCYFPVVYFFFREHHAHFFFHLIFARVREGGNPCKETTNPISFTLPIVYKKGQRKAALLDYSPNEITWLRVLSLWPTVP